MLLQKANECKRKSRTNHILTGITFCKKCGARITYTKNHGKNFKIICSNYKNNGKKACDNIYMDEEKVINIIKKSILEQIKKQKITNIKTRKNIKNIEKIHNLEKEKEKSIRAIKQIYNDVQQEIISIEVARKIINQYQEENKNTEKTIQYLKEQIKEESIDILQAIRTSKPNQLRSLIFCIIDKIEISKNQITLHYKFCKK